LEERERKRLGIIQFDYKHTENFTDEQRSLRRPKLIIVNAVLTISLITILLMGIIPAPALFVVASIVALMINY
jgi:CitMHS family citrate-Mg2+:H+ or citrate-Ca2+:H+ symporter